MWRLLVMCTAWSVGVVLVWTTEAYSLGTVVPALFAVAAFVLTRSDTDAGPGGGGQPKYWRGRRIDGGPRGRWN